MWDIGYHFLKPLTIMISYNVNFICTGIEKKSFDYIKKIVTFNNLLAYLYFNKIFDTHTKRNPIGSVHDPIGKSNIII